MGWKGIAIGGYLGSVFGGPLGAIMGAVIGHKLENKFAGEGKESEKPRQNRYSSYSGSSNTDKSFVFCVSAAAMLAKMAKADGVVTREEIACVEEAFSRLGFTSTTRAYAIDAFRRAKNDPHSIYDYAREFAAAVQSVGVRELFYELLWDLACADGVVSEEERTILRLITNDLQVRSTLYIYFASRRMSEGGYGGAGSRRQQPRQPSDELEEAYQILGASASDSDETLKRKYRDLAKKNHPDVLRAQGLPEEMINKASERMSRINAAWETVRKSRN